MKVKYGSEGVKPSSRLFALNDVPQVNEKGPQFRIELGACSSGLSTLQFAGKFISTFYKEVLS